MEVSCALDTQLDGRYRYLRSKRTFRLYLEACAEEDPGDAVLNFQPTLNDIPERRT